MPSRPPAARGIDVVARRHRRAPADAGSPDGGAAQGQARARDAHCRARRTRSCSCWTPTPARTRLAQVKAFDAAVGLTGLVVTKLDGSAKGGVVAAIAKQHPVPLKFIGVGRRGGRPAPVRRPRVRRRPAAGATRASGRPARDSRARQSRQIAAHAPARSSAAGRLSAPPGVAVAIASSLAAGLLGCCALLSVAYLTRLI